MEDKKNLVIKVKYPSSEHKSSKNIHSSQKMTEWNINRLLIAFAFSTLLIALVIFFIMRPAKELDLKPSIAATETVNAESKDKSKVAFKNTITRAQATLLT